jgi:hypothetical protein
VDAEHHVRNRIEPIAGDGLLASPALPVGTPLNALKGGLDSYEALFASATHLECHLLYLECVSARDSPHGSVQGDGRCRVAGLVDLGLKGSA